MLFSCRPSLLFLLKFDKLQKITSILHALSESGKGMQDHLPFAKFSCREKL
ncbi:hypothetical cytosolic protein [Syntrophus aciditrophicus SB]|uniref:Hypothetical cytosolic protein n=1 Tax=Syntrophus aciditrophicus (strain SB) TaxID=56780 RepID=Q2LXP5_SYNAS|nr:hypothetical cytosolic protein [Syntrophus aciditrophicus SB]